MINKKLFIFLLLLFPAFLSQAGSTQYGGNYSNFNLYNTIRLDNTLGDQINARGRLICGYRTYQVWQPGQNNDRTVYEQLGKIEITGEGISTGRYGLSDNSGYVSGRFAPGGVTYSTIKNGSVQKEYFNRVSIFSGNKIILKDLSVGKAVYLNNDSTFISNNQIDVVRTQRLSGAAINLSTILGKTIFEFGTSSNFPSYPTNRCPVKRS